MEAWYDLNHAITPFCLPSVLLLPPLLREFPLFSFLFLSQLPFSEVGIDHPGLSFLQLDAKDPGDITNAKSEFASLFLDLPLFHGSLSLAFYFLHS